MSNVSGTLPGISISPYGKIWDTYQQINNPVGWLKGLIGKLGYVFYTQSLLTPPTLWVFDPKAVEGFMWDPVVADKNTMAYRMLINSLGETIITIPDDATWRKRRKDLTAAYRPEGGKTMDIYKNIILQEVNNLIAKWDMEIAVSGGSAIVDPVADLKKMSLDAIIAIMFGREDIPDEIWSLPDNINAIINFLMVRSVLGEKAANLIAGSRLKQSNEIAKVGMDKVMRIAIESEADRSYMVDVLVDMLTSGKITRAEFYAELKTAIVAGFETTANTMPYALSMIAYHSEFAAKALKSRPDALTTDGLDNWEYVKWLTNESLRMLSAAPQLDRHLLIDLQAGKYIIPAGTTVTTHAHIMSTLEDVYADASIFYPDRWATTGFVRAGQLTFGGDRRCLGEAIARAEIAYVLGSLIARYNIWPVTVIPPKVNATFTMKLETKGENHKIWISRR